MPKVRPLGRSAKLAKRWQDADDCLRDQLAVFFSRTGMKKEELGALIGIRSLPTIRKRIESPSTFSIQELRMLADAFDANGLSFDMTLGESRKEMHA